ncbi:glycosyltransferase family 4 protein [Idiomarina piscisalsi]|uniref:Glycosyl hydrolase family 1 n=1 Tax=Idiomarina piscisalsi TaxID=1096243 RepID=A0A432YRI9_9GAMM|nr:glycosyltransferase family 4 protein [Idiomarina piscisalsi]RUO64285.1 glycosyl hydrolase family 1 [Idiomarina piscisalsi]
MKVLYLVSTLKRTGPTNQLLNLVSRVSNKFETVVVTLSPEENDSLKNDFIGKGVKVRSLNLSRLAGLFWSKKALKEVILDEQPDIIHSQGVRSDSLAVRASSFIPSITTVRNFPQLDLLMTYGNFKGKLLELNQLKALRKMSAVCGVSRAVTRNLISHYGLDKVTCVLNGVDTERYSSVSNDIKEERRKSLNLPVSEYQFISTGHLSSRKNPIGLINAFREAFGTGEKVSLVMVGGGELESECKLLAKDLNIHFTGRVTNVHDYLAASDCFVSVSLAEGMPNAALEAMATGLPVILSDIPPHKEIFELNSNIGSQFRLNEPDELVSKLKSMISDNRDSYTAALSEIIESELSADVMASRYMSLYKSILGT